MTKVDDLDLDAMNAQIVKNTAAIADFDQRVGSLESSQAAPPLPAPALEITPDQVLAALRTALLGSATAGTGTTSGTPAPTPGTVPAFTGTAVATASDQNSYPLAMPANVEAAAPVMIGTGPESLDLLISNSPGQPQPCEFIVILVKPDGTQVAVAGPLICSSYVGQTPAGAQHFSIKGPWGGNAKFQISPASEGAGDLGMFLMGASINLIPMGIWSFDNSRGGGPLGESWTFNSNDAPMTLQLASNGTPPEFAAAQTAATAASAPPSFTATPTQISGQTLDQIVAAGGDVVLPAMQIVGDGRLPANENLTGAGIGKTIIDGTNLEPKQDKALLVVGGNGCTISAMTIENAYVPIGLGLNASGVRNETGAVDVDLSQVEILGCQDGVMTQSDTAGKVTIDRCHIHGNGDASQPGVKGTSAATHNLYLGGLPSAVATLTNNLIEACRDVHEVKSRCGTTIAQGNTVTTGGNGCCYELPNGGKFSAINETWTLPANASDRRFLSHSAENTNNAAVGSDVMLTNVVLVDLTGQGGIVMAMKDPNAVLTLIGCTYKGAVKPQFVGWSKVIGDVAPAA